jgi:antitoxin (DNA-binding transcriptional repressor) of toxin-antitoxin stability system
MDMYSVADAQNRLSELIDRAAQGEPVLIARHGRPVAELRAIPADARPITPADLDWLAVHRVGGKPAREDAGTLVSRMRDEDER